jgi:hypothetical protein
MYVLLRLLASEMWMLSIALHMFVRPMSFEIDELFVITILQKLCWCICQNFIFVLRNITNYINIFIDNKCTNLKSIQHMFKIEPMSKPIYDNCNNFLNL